MRLETKFLHKERLYSHNKGSDRRMYSHSTNWLKELHANTALFLMSVFFVSATHTHFTEGTFKLCSVVLKLF